MSSLFRRGRSRRVQDFSKTPGPNKKSNTFSIRGVERQRALLERAYRSCQGKDAEDLFFQSRVVVPADDDNEWESDNEDNGMVLDVLDGRTVLEISHGGEELGLLIQKALQLIKPKRDARSRRNRTQNRNAAFARIMDQMVQAYLQWQTTGQDGFECNLPSPSGARIKDYVVFDLFRSYSTSTSEFTVPELVERGFIPSAPEKPSFLITTRVLQLYHALQLRCPHLSIQPFVKALCGLQGTEYRSTCCEQFTICYDAYLGVRDGARALALKALGRGGKDWRLKNACPCCCYKVAGEPQLEFDMLITMDGNNSLKRILRRDPTSGEIATSAERLDTREVNGDYYLPSNVVDRWKKGGGLAEGSAVKEDITPSPCSERWKNLTDSITSKMWSVFDETGIFASLCRHGFVLVVADMLRSGELAKYPLAVLEKIVEVFDQRVGGGYDIGCGFLTTLLRSALRESILNLGYRSLVGAFHGHAHNRLCQIDNLTTYVKGLGLEDLEGAERFFSKSNALAASTRHASTFHRRQKISQFIQGNDTFEVYPNLSKFLVNNYKQALGILAGRVEFEEACKNQHITDASVFPRWLVEEKEYLTSLKQEPEEETVKINYLEALMKFYECENKLNADKAKWVQMTSAQSYSAASRETANRERQNRQLIELRDKALDAVHNLENHLLLLPIQRWIPGTKVWVDAEVLMRKRDYQRSLDQLESLVVARLFELSKMNLANTGYKLRTHIANALKTRSQAIRTALDKYNAAASKLKPPGQKLDWDEVSEYTFLADFELLRDSRQDVRKHDWGKPAARRLMDQYFKLERAQEEIGRLNVEIKRLLTYIEDEKSFFELSILTLKATNPTLAHEARLYYEERSRANSMHRKRLETLARMDGFTGTLEVGRARNTKFPWTRTHSTAVQPQEPAPEDAKMDGGEEPEEDESDDEEDAQLEWMTDNFIELGVGEGQGVDSAGPEH